VLAFYLVMQCI